MELLLKQILPVLLFNMLAKMVRATGSTKRTATISRVIVPSTVFDVEDKFYWSTLHHRLSDWIHALSICDKASNAKNRPDKNGTHRPMYANQSNRETSKGRSHTM
jgi:hypothetical protein